jgi:DNA-binding transcriptional LysR family regulator
LHQSINSIFLSGHAAGDRMTPNDIDLSDLKILKLVHHHRSFTRAAEAVDQNQSTVSYRIDKLRKAFDDPLFVRVGGRLATTRRCDEIVQFANATLDQLEALLSGSEFDPLEAEDSLCISCNQYQRALILPIVFRMVRNRAPRLKLRIITASTKGAGHLKSGEADLLICPIRLGGEGFFQRRLLGEHYVCVMHRDNPLAAAPFGPDAYLDAEHATVNYGDGWESGWEKVLEEKGIRLNEAITVPSPADLVNILPGTGLVSTLPSRLALSLGPDFRIRPCPFPAPFDINLYWTARTHQVALHAWVRDLIVTAAAECEAATASFTDEAASAPGRA